MGEAVKTETHPDTQVVSPAAGSPFAGMTYAQARLMNSALHGLPVEVYGGKFEEGPEVYIFDGMVLPGMWATDPIQGVSDLKLTHAEYVDGCWLPKPGLSRVLSAGLVRRFDVLAIEPEWWCCETCGAVVPRTKRVWDVARISNDLRPDGEFKWDHRFECDGCWWSC